MDQLEVNTVVSTKLTLAHHRDLYENIAMSSGSESESSKTVSIVKKSVVKPATEPSAWKKRQDITKKNAEKYHYVRFVEKKKLTRKITKTRALLVELMEKGQDTSAGQAELRTLQDDMEYVQRFPLDEKYIALFPTTLSEDAKKKQEELRNKIKVRNARRDELESRSNAKKLKHVSDDFFDSGKKKVNDQKTGSKVKRDAKVDHKKVKQHTHVPSSSFKKPMPHHERKPVVPVSRDKQQTENHPSWAAKSDPKLKGTLSGFEGKRMTFEDDDE